MKLTQYIDINIILNRFNNELSGLMSEGLVGIYLTGSLTYGDFNRGSSDIDLLVVTKSLPTEKLLQKIVNVHKNIGKEYPAWSKRIEVSYITEKMLQNKRPPKQKRPYFNAGKMWHFPYGEEWVLTLYLIRKYGVALTGPDPKKLFPKVRIEDVIEASKRNLLKEWKPKLKEKSPFKNPDYDRSHLQAYAILTMCRILYTAKNKKISSKKDTSTWTKKFYGKQWESLIEKAEKWRHGDKINLESETLNFIEFTIDKVIVHPQP